jgi:hypothetical protein
MKQIQNQVPNEIIEIEQHPLGQTKQVMKVKVKANERTKVKTNLTREDMALELFQAGAVSKDKISDDLYYVKSQDQKNPDLAYEVIPSMNVCTCMDFERTGLACKHIIATQVYRTSQIAATLTAAKIEALNRIGRVKVVMATC